MSVNKKVAKQCLSLSSCLAPLKLKLSVKHCNIIPYKLIKNKEGRNIMNKEIHDIDNRWRPPGRLK